MNITAVFTGGPFDGKDDLEVPSQQFILTVSEYLNIGVTLEHTYFRHPNFVSAESGPVPFIFHETRSVPRQ